MGIKENVDQVNSRLSQLYPKSRKKFDCSAFYKELCEQEGTAAGMKRCLLDKPTLTYSSFQHSPVIVESQRTDR